MSVYQIRVLDMLRSAMDAMHRNSRVHMSIDLTHEEFTKAFIEEEHIDILSEASRIVGNINTGVSVSRVGVTPVLTGIFQFVQNTVHLPVPQYVRAGLARSCPEDIRERIEQSAREFFDIEMVWWDTYDAVNFLNEICTTSSDIRALLPCFPTIMANADDRENSVMSKSATKLANTRRVGTLPRLPREVKDRLQGISAVVNGLCMGEAVPQSPLARGMTRLAWSGRYNCVAFAQTPEMHFIDRIGGSEWREQYYWALETPRFRAFV